MGLNKKRRAEEARRKAKAKRNSIISVLTMLVIVVVVCVLVLNKLGSGNEVYAEGIEINKTEVLTKGYKFYPYKVDGNKLEVIAVKGSDGTIRTAFNTCQICYSSGRGYYEVKGSSLVCNNCGNVFTFDQVEREQGGCNPVPIMSKEKTDNGEMIIISHELIKQNSVLFKTWK